MVLAVGTAVRSSLSVLLALAVMVWLLLLQTIKRPAEQKPQPVADCRLQASIHPTSEGESLIDTPINSLTIARVCKVLGTGLLIVAMGSLTGCSDPQVYGSVGVSSGWGGSGFGSGVHTSISVGGRIR